MKAELAVLTLTVTACAADTTGLEGDGAAHPTCELGDRTVPFDLIFGDGCNVCSCVNGCTTAHCTDEMGMLIVPANVMPCRGHADCARGTSQGVCLFDPGCGADPTGYCVFVQTEAIGDC